MKKKYVSKTMVYASLLTMVFVLSLSAASIEYSYTETSSPMYPELLESHPYQGRLRIYIAEPLSRWFNQPNSNYDPIQYHFGFLDFALDTAINLEYQGSYENSILWDGNDNGFGDIQEDNIIVMAAVFNPEVFVGYSDPPDQKPFNAHYVDAAAAATPGTKGYSIVNENFTHTVFAEEGTGTYCSPCRDAMTAMENIYESHDYPFYYLSMVLDENTVANSYMSQTYNVYGIPAVYFDGGARVQIGASSSIEGVYRNKIVSTGKRDVHEFNLSLSVTWLGSAQLQIDVNLTNNEEMNPPETPAAPEGPSTGYAGIEYTFNVTTTDPEDNKIIYTINWGDGIQEESQSFNSGAIAQLKHRWEDPGTYQVKVKARDTGGGGYESDWSPTAEIVIEPPIFDITIDGSLFEVSANIVNSVDETFTDVNWTIKIEGGILNGIQIRDTGEFETFGPGEEEKISPHDTVFGFGKIDIEVMVETTQKTATGFVLGIYVIVR